jgi:hypothetical protein
MRDHFTVTLTARGVRATVTTAGGFVHTCTRRGEIVALLARRAGRFSGLLAAWDAAPRHTAYDHHQPTATVDEILTMAARLRSAP